MRNVLVDSGPRGQLLLCCVRAYVELDVLASLDIHTDETIAFGREVANRFLKLANVSHSEPAFCVAAASMLAETPGI